MQINKHIKQQKKPLREAKQRAGRESSLGRQSNF